MSNCFSAPDKDCRRCPGLYSFREANRKAHPEFYNGAVPAFGALDAPILVVGLAPGLQGANATGRPFTGDYAGDVLYSSLLKQGLAVGNYSPAAFGAGRGSRSGAGNGGDGLRLVDTRITNAVRCVPPENKPETSEIKHCNGFLKSEISAMPNLRVVLTLGGVAHKAVLMALGMKQSACKFEHGAEYQLKSSEFRVQSSVGQNVQQEAGAGDRKAVILLNSYHCSRYNINTRRLTQEMFDAVVARARTLATPGSSMRRP